MSRCRSCGAHIVWAKTRSGKRMPLDADPVEGGNIQLRNGVAHYVEPGPIPRYKSHFATCEHADQHRRGHESQDHRDT